MDDAGGTFRGRRIFIVEDNPLHRALMEDALSERYELELVADSVTALTRLGGKKWQAYDLVVVDLRLPARPGEPPTPEEGKRILEMLQAESMGAPPVVLVVSGDLIGQARAQLAKLGARRVFEKPFSLIEFREYIDAMFDGREALRASR
jgi:CheY-like chemotaxis protein